VVTLARAIVGARMAVARCRQWFRDVTFSCLLFQVFFGSETHRRPELEFSTVFLSWWNSAANQLIKMQFLIMPHLIDYSFLKTKILKADF
jgi:hypothetical protein